MSSPPPEIRPCAGADFVAMCAVINAAAAKDGCSISNALKVNVELSVQAMLA